MLGGGVNEVVNEPGDNIFSDIVDDNRTNNNTDGFKDASESFFSLPFKGHNGGTTASSILWSIAESLNMLVSL